MGTSRGVLVPRDIEKLEDEDFEREVVLSELRSAYALAGDSDKLGLAYALAHFGQVDAEFLVSQIKEQPTTESKNLRTALLAATESVTHVTAEHVQQADADEDWSFKSRLATIALRFGDFSGQRDAQRGSPGSVALGLEGSGDREDEATRE